jgi:rhodanese-related sulfurtransferase
MNKFPGVDRHILLRMGAIILVSLIIGLVYNQFHPKGLHWQFLFSPALNTDRTQGNHFTVISADSALNLLNTDNVLFVDTRNPQDYKLDHISGSLNIPLDLFFTATSQIGLPRDKSHIVLYDEEGDLEKLALAVSVIKSEQLESVSVLFGGYLAWLNMGLPVEQDVSHDE